VNITIKNELFSIIKYHHFLHVFYVKQGAKDDLTLFAYLFSFIGFETKQKTHL